MLEREREREGGRGVGVLCSLLAVIKNELVHVTVQVVCVGEHPAGVCVCVC